MKTFKIHQEVTFYKMNEIQAETEKEALELADESLNKDIYFGSFNDYFDETDLESRGEK